MAGPRASMEEGGGGLEGLEGWLCLFERVGLGGEGEGFGEWLMERGRSGRGGSDVVVFDERGGCWLEGFIEASIGLEPLLVRSEENKGA